jgi:hypothetical protein
LRHGRWWSIKHHSPPLLGAPRAKNCFQFLFGIAVRRYDGAAVQYGRWCSIQHHSSPWLGAPLAKDFLKVFSVRDCGTAVRYGGAVRRCGAAVRCGGAVRRCGKTVRYGGAVRQCGTAVRYGGAQHHSPHCLARRGRRMFLSFFRYGTAVRRCGTALRYGGAARQMVLYSTSLSPFAWRAAGKIF